MGKFSGGVSSVFRKIDPVGAMIADSTGVDPVGLYKKEQAPAAPQPAAAAKETVEEVKKVTSSKQKSITKGSSLGLLETTGTLKSLLGN